MLVEAGPRSPDLVDNKTKQKEGSISGVRTRFPWIRGLVHTKGEERFVMLSLPRCPSRGGEMTPTAEFSRMAGSLSLPGPATPPLGEAGMTERWGGRVVMRRVASI